MKEDEIQLVIIRLMLELKHRLRYEKEDKNSDEQ